MATTILSQGFENGGTIPSGWVDTNVSGTSIPWTFISGANGGTPAAPHTGSYNANCYKASTTPSVQRLESPTMNLVGYSGVTLSFWHAQGFYSPDQDEMRVYYKTGSTGTWTLLPGATWTNDISVWSGETFSLPNTSAATQYQIGFEATAKWGYGVVVDDVLITGDFSAATPNTVTSSSSLIATKSLGTLFLQNYNNLPTHTAFTGSIYVDSLSGGTYKYEQTYTGGTGYINTWEPVYFKSNYSMISTGKTSITCTAAGSIYIVGSLGITNWTTGANNGFTLNTGSTVTYTGKNPCDVIITANIWLQYRSTLAYFYLGIAKNLSLAQGDYTLNEVWSTTAKDASFGITTYKSIASGDTIDLGLGSGTAGAVVDVMSISISINTL